MAVGPQRRGARTLGTARAALRALAFLMEHPDGVRADELAAMLGKSLSTAYYLLSSLCAEGFAVHEHGLYRPSALADGRTPADGAAPRQAAGLRSAVDELFLRTQRRSYLAIVQGPAIVVVAARGRQGMPRLLALGSDIRPAAHALALGKVVLSLLPPPALGRYLASGATAFTRRTVTDADALAGELARARREGIAVEREEYRDHLCSVAAPIRRPGGAFVAALGVSSPARGFASELDALAVAIRAVARASGDDLRADCRGASLQASANPPGFLPGAAGRH